MHSLEDWNRRRAMYSLALGELIRSRALWTTLLITSLLTGFGFRQALALYSEASRAALDAPGLAAGLRPLDGVLVPTFGSLYLSSTLLLPFVAIRLLGGEKESGALLLTLQVCASRWELFATRLVALTVGWLAVVGVPVSALMLWWLSGGHVHWPEVFGLLLGHCLYAFVVVALALLASAVADSASTAAILVLGATLGSWALDFASQRMEGPAAVLAGLSLTRSIRPLETGLLAADHTAAWLVAGSALVALAGSWIHPGVSLQHKLRDAAVIVGTTSLLLAALLPVRASWDLTEDRRHSFAPEVEEALKALPGRLEVTVFLRPEDPRADEIERGILGRLRRTVPDLVVRYADVDGASRFGPRQDRYGEVEYRYGERTSTSRSTSQREAVTLLLELTGASPAAGSGATAYAGYPLVLQDRWGALWFYGALPMLVVAGELRTLQQYVRWRSR